MAYVISITTTMEKSCINMIFYPLFIHDNTYVISFFLLRFSPWFLSPGLASGRVTEVALGFRGRGARKQGGRWGFWMGKP